MVDGRGVPGTGKDFKTGQTLMKTIIAPGLKARMLGFVGWYSTNILGNRDHRADMGGIQEWLSFYFKSP